MTIQISFKKNHDFILKREQALSGFANASTPIWLNTTALTPHLVGPTYDAMPLDSSFISLWDSVGRQDWGHTERSQP